MLFARKINKYVFGYSINLIGCLNKREGGGWYFVSVNLKGVPKGNKIKIGNDVE